MRIRKCFRCGKELDYDSYIKNGSPNVSEHLTKIWNCKYIEFYCYRCYCFKTKYQPLFESKNINCFEIN